jgi:predicted phage terminase large subunit-like protein
MDDPTGRALRDFKSTPQKPIVRLRFPAIAEADDALGRAAGEALWPERYPIEELRAIEERMGEYSWSALYQQNPVPAEGGIFKLSWFSPLHDHCPDIIHAVRYWDLAMSEKTSADFTVGVKLGQAVDGHYYVIDVARQRVDWGNLTDFIATVMLQDGATCLQGIEEKGYMSRAIQDLNADPRLHGYSIFGYPVDKDKVTRALPYAAKCGAGLVHVLNHHFAQAYIEELCSFPYGTHDDQVDASSGAWAMIGDAGTMAYGAVTLATYNTFQGA